MIGYGGPLRVGLTHNGARETRMKELSLLEGGSAST
jgi:hypothetical protein